MARRNATFNRRSGIVQLAVIPTRSRDSNPTIFTDAIREERPIIRNWVGVWKCIRVANRVILSPLGFQRKYYFIAPCRNIAIALRNYRKALLLNRFVLSNLRFHEIIIKEAKRWKRPRICANYRGILTREEKKLKLRERERSLPRVFFAKLTKLDGKKIEIRRKGDSVSGEFYSFLFFFNYFLLKFE